MGEKINILDVSARDGLQNESRLISTADKLTLIAKLVQAGVRDIQATSFVHPRWVPQMADAEALAAHFGEFPGVRFSALVPNVKGYERAVASGVRYLEFVLSASDTFNRKNLNRTLSESLCGVVPQPMGNENFTAAPSGTFRTADRLLNIAANEDSQYHSLCDLIERTDLKTDPRFATPKARSANRDVLTEILMPITRQKTSAEWVRLLNDAGVPCGPIYRVDESFADPQVRHLKMAQPVRSPALGDLTILGHPVSHGETRLPIRTAAPELGQDNEEILTSIGYSKEQIADLAQRGII